MSGKKTMKSKPLAILFVMLCISGCFEIPSVQKQTPPISTILTRTPESWDLPDCRRVIDHYTAESIKNARQFLFRGYSGPAEVYVRVAPFNRQVLTARARMEAIQRRLPPEAFRQRLDRDLQIYTNWRLDSTGTKFVSKTEVGDSLLQEATFQVTFENISDPPRTIEIFRAEEGFFLENEAGEFGRVIAVGGFDTDEYFILVNVLKMELTFKLITDSGKVLNYNDESRKNFRLVFNGLQQEPVIVDL